MYVLIVTAGVDWLLPSVSIPAFGWVLIIMLWVAKKSVLEAKKPDPKKRTEAPKIITHHKWILSTEHDGVYATPSGYWAVVSQPHGGFILYGDEDECVNLSAKNLGEALDQADEIINVVEPKEA